MKKIVIRKNVVKTLLSSAVLCLMLAACKNFLNAGNIKEEIEQQIYINNHECPVATVEEPVFSDGGVAWNKTIIISFSLPMDPDTFIESYNIKDFDGKSVLDNYMAPEWFNNNTKVVIYANELNPLVIPEGKTKDFYITLSKKCTTEDGLPIKTAINHKYRLNSVNENVPPVMASTTNVKRPYVKYNNVIISYPITLVEGELDAQSEDIICQTNHVNSDLEFYVEGSDFGGGKVNAYITYSRINDIGGSAIQSPVVEKVIEELNQKNENGNSYKTIPFAFKSEAPDGLYKFTLCIEDQYHGYSEEKQTYYIIRDTNMAKSSNALIWFESPNFRKDFTKNEQNIYPAPFDSMIPTEEKIDAIRKSVQFQQIIDDTYYVSTISGENNKKVYFDKYSEYTYLFSWGTSLNNLTSPVKASNVIEKDVADYYGYTIPSSKPSYEVTRWAVDENGNYKLDEDGNKIPAAYTYDSWLQCFLYDTYANIDGTDVRAMSSTKILYTLPSDYEEYVKSHPNDDVFLQATVIDSVGNSNTVTTVSPKKPKFYGYTIEDVIQKDDQGNPVLDDQDEPIVVAKKATLNYSDYTGADLSSIVNIPDKMCIENYRIFYAPIPAGCDENYTDTLELERNTVVPWIQDQYSGITDSNVIEIPKKDGTFSKYVVYIQPNYSTNSVLIGTWTGQTFGPYYKVIIDPYKGSENWEDPNPDPVPVPASITISEIKHESAGPSTGLLNVTVTLSAPDERYVPCYKTKDVDNWIYPDFTITDDKTELYFTIQNPLRAPTERIDKDSYPGNNWRQQDGWWDNEETKPRYLFRDDFWESIERIKDRGWYNYKYDVDIKVQVSSGNKLVESTSKTLELWADKDDNIPPYPNHQLTTHDSMLSKDGHSFEFTELIKEDQAHMVKTFKYYYTQYNEAWGDNLSVLSDDEIRALPYGMSKLKSNCWVDKDWSYYPENERDKTDKVYITFTPVIPIKGLDNGKYMFFGEFSDTVGNTCIITLGKAEIGTLKNRPKVTWNVDEDNTANRDSIKIDFTRESYENFDEWYVYVEILDGSKGVWNELFDYYSSLQKLNFNGGNTASLTFDCTTPSYTDWEDGQFKPSTFSGGTIWTVGDRHGDKNNQGNVTARHLPRWTYYKVTVQAFNTHPYDEATNTGVNKYYEMPYKEYEPNNPKWNPNGGEYKGYLQGATEYDLCTEETASCSTYMYFPGYEIENGKVNYTEQQYELQDIRYSFSPYDATIMSNTKYLVNVYTSIINLGNDIEAWERKGKLIKSHYYEPRSTPKRWVEENPSVVALSSLSTDIQSKLVNDGDCFHDKENNIFYRRDGQNVKQYVNIEQDNEYYHEENDPSVNPFSFNKALDDLYNSEETGFVYYACVVHFADDTSVISDVRSGYCN